MANKFSWNGTTYTIRSWDGGRLNTKAHGPGTLVDEFGFTRQCTLNHGVISGYSWYTTTSGYKVAAVFNTKGTPHGTQLWLFTNGVIDLDVYNNGELESSVQGMMCIQYI